MLHQRSDTLDPRVRLRVPQCVERGAGGGVVLRLVSARARGVV
jgi:hypothetical protein